MWRAEANLDITGADDIVVPYRVAVLDLALEGDGDRLESPVRVLSHAKLLGCGLEALWRAVVEPAVYLGSNIYN